MDEARKGSVHQTGTFHGHCDIPPQAVFSESHLDTLGFCVWLALTKKESPENTILLIDDIFTSVDASHLIRIIELLNAERRNFLQMIVATHFRLWRDHCQNAHNIQRIQLGTWTAEKGLAFIYLQEISKKDVTPLTRRSIERIVKKYATIAGIFYFNKYRLALSIRRN